ncbi:MAG: RIO kinase 1 [Myxococcota bacterium]|jgi:RIO kinase 1
MRVPSSLMPLIDQGVIEEVIRPVQSGKEAEVFLVISRGERCIAKVYKDTQTRSFKHRSQYTEGRNTRNSRDQRAMSRRTRYGRGEEEQAWRSKEVDVLERLQETTVPVPRLYDFIDGVLVMEMIVDDNGEPAPRLADVNLHPDEARELFFILLHGVQCMLCVGVVHGDLSDFNVLLTPSGPVIIDFPQAVDPAHNRNARQLLIRDVFNLTTFLSRFVPNLRRTKYGEEMWELYERGELTPTTKLTGKVKRKSGNIDLESLMAEIASANEEDLKRREALGLPPRRPARAPRVREEEVVEEEAPAAPSEGGSKRRRRRSGGGGGGGGQGNQQRNQQGGQQRNQQGGQQRNQQGGQQRNQQGGQQRNQQGGQQGSSQQGSSQSSGESGAAKKRRRRRRRRPSDKPGGRE